jgi:uncharacterized cupredoxin-like copper-binding protein
MSTRARIAAVAPAAVLTWLAVGGAAPGGNAVVPPRTVKVVLSEWKVVPSVKRLQPGKVTFVVRNGGSIPHELVVLGTAKHHHALPLKGAEAAEAGRRGGTEELAPGKTRRVTLTLKRGAYVLLCNLPGHYRAGQYASLTIR